MGFLKNLTNIIALVLLLTQPVLVYAATADNSLLVYELHVLYQNGKISVNPNAQTPYDFIAKEYFDEQGSSSGSVVARNGEVIGRFSYNLIEGKNDIIAPYFPAAARIILYAGRDAQANNQLGAIDVSMTSTCNQDAKCQPDFGETVDNCPSDCKIEVTPPVQNNPAPTPNGIITVLMAVLVILIIVFIVTAVYFYRKAREEK